MRHVFVAWFALRRPALRNVIDRVKAERAGPTNSQAVNSVVPLQRERWRHGSRTMKERRRPESESDRKEPFLWYVRCLTESRTREERRLCHSFSIRIENAPTHDRGGKNGPVALVYEKNRPVLITMILDETTRERMKRRLKAGDCECACTSIAAQHDDVVPVFATRRLSLAHLSLGHA
jgi:hypothetical protein